MNNTDKENDLIKDLYKRRGEFISEAKIMIAQALCAADIEDAGGDTYIDNFCEGYFQGRVSSFTGEITSLKAELENKDRIFSENKEFNKQNRKLLLDNQKLRNELEKARELIRDILKYETICSPDRYLLAEEFLNKGKE